MTSPSERATMLELLKEVPDGRYATAIEENDFRFFRVKTYKKPPKTGLRVIQIQMSDAWAFAGRVPLGYGLEVGYFLSRDIQHFKLMLCDPFEAAMNYGEQLGECCICGRTLTDQRSRELLIGPECEKQSPGFIAHLLSKRPHLAHWVLPSSPPSSPSKLTLNGTKVVRPPRRQPRLLS